MVQGDGQGRLPAQLPWSPFPVQDWSTMPPAGRPDDDQLRVPGGEPTPEPGWFPDPSWAPPGRRRAWLPTVVMALCLLMVGSSLFLTDLVGSAAPAQGSAVFVPEDGAAWYSEQRSLAGGRAITTRQVTESARYVGPEGVSSLDFTLGSRVLGAVGGSAGLNAVQFWRTTTTQVGTLDSTHQRVQVYAVSDAVELVAESGPSSTYVYRPALVELPARVTAGSSWSTRGSATDQLNYAASFTASAADAGCITVTGTIAYTSLSGQPGLLRRLARTWCENQGVVSSSEEQPGVRVTEQRRTGPGEMATLQTTAEPWTWPASQQWVAHDHGVITVDPYFGQGPMVSTPASMPPVLTASGLQIRTSTAGQDLIAFTPKTRDDWMALWRMHPGGTVLSLTAFGDVVVATTSERTLVGYSASGVRLWRVELDELVLTAPQRVSTGAIVATSVGGEVLTIDLATGRTGWRASIGSDVGARVSAGAGTVVVLSRNGDAVALRAADGHELWRVALTDPSHAAVLGDTVVVLDDNYVNGFDRRSGERRWRAVYPSLVGDVITLQGLVVVVGKEGTLAIDGSGRVRWRRQGYLDMVSDGTDLVGLTGDRADVLSRGGALRSSFAIPRYTAVSARHALVHPQGLWLFSGGWPFKDYSNGS